MSKEKFTQGSWFAFIGKHGVQEISNNRGSIVVSWSGFDDSTVNFDEEKSANANLIAAAPDMYRSLQRQRKSLLNLIEFNLVPDRHVNQLNHEISLIDNELAKARGE